MSKSLSYFKAVTFLLVTFRVKKLLHFASKVVTFRVNVAFCVNCNILRRNKGSWHFSHCIYLLQNHEVMRTFCFLKTESYHNRACFLKSWLYSLSLKKKRFSVALRERDDYPVKLTYKQHPHILQ